MDDNIAAFFNFLNSQGYNPHWSDRVYGSGVIARIDCSNGPIRSIKFYYTTVVTKWGGHEGTEPIAWATHYHTSFGVMPDWGRKRIPGIHRLIIKNADIRQPVRQVNFEIASSNYRWDGNDMGLGIIWRLNADEPLRSLSEVVAIIPRPVNERENQDRTDEDQQVINSTRDLHDVEDCYFGMIHTWLSPEAKSKDKLPPVHWETPPLDLWRHLESIARHLLLQPKWLPKEGHVDTYPVPAPRISYIHWSAWFLLVLGVLGIGAAAISLDWRQSLDSWMRWGGTAVLVGCIIALIYPVGVFIGTYPAQYPVPVSGTRYLRWCAASVFVLGVVGIGAAAISSDWRESLDNWMRIGGIVVLTGGIMTLIFLVGTLLAIRAGLEEVVGTISRKWESTDQGKVQPFIRVEELPFKVSLKASHGLSVGDEVVLAFWPRSKTVARVDKLTTSVRQPITK